MSTLRNKRLLKEQQNCVSSSSGSGGGNANEGLYRKVAVSDLKKISRAVVVLKHANARLGQLLKSATATCEVKYKRRLQSLQTALERKDRRIKVLERKLAACRYICAVRQNNCILFFTKVSGDTLPANCQVIAHRVSEDPSVDRSICVSVAKSKYKDRVKHKPRRLIFDNVEDAENFAQDIKRLLGIIDHD